MKIILPLFLLLCLAACTKPTKEKPKPVIVKGPVLGDKIDSLNGVYVYYNGGVGNTSGRNTTRDGYNLGIKYQCVEFIKRYYYQYYKHKMPDSYGNAKDFYEKGIKDGAMNKKRGLIQYGNPSKTRPEVGDILILDGNKSNPYGHVCIVSKTNDEEIEIIQQNPGPFAPSRTTYSVIKVGKRYMIGNLKILGRLRIKDS